MSSNIWFRPKSAREKRVVFHVRSRVGLGHINRSVTVAQWLRQQLPHVNILFLIEGGEDLVEPAHIPYIHLGHLSEGEQCQEITRSVIRTFQPDLVIYETFLEENVYRPIMESGGIKQAVMGNVGDVLREEFAEKLPVLNKMDLLLILQQQIEVTPQDQAMLAQYSGRMIFAGPLVRQKTQIPASELRQKLGLSASDKAILLTLGGGGYDIAEEMLANMLATGDKVRAHYPQARLIVITGLHFKGHMPHIDDYVCYASKFEPYFTDFINIASVVVSMAGYSTVNEIAGSGVPAICVPAGEADDQLGLGSMSEYALSFPNMSVSATNVEELAEKLIASLAKERNLSAITAFWNRAQRASQHIVGEISSLLEHTS